MNTERIAAVVRPILESRGLELDELEILPAGNRRVVRIVVDGDGPHGRGPLLDDIARTTRAISAELDSSDATGEAAYTLEVTSRGTSRPLTRPVHWRRNQGRLVKLRADGETFVGRIVSSDETGAVLNVEGVERRVQYVDAAKPLIQVELNRPADPDLDEVDAEGEEGNDAEGGGTDKDGDDVAEDEE